MAAPALVLIFPSFGIGCGIEGGLSRLKKKYIIIGVVAFLIFESICITGYCMLKKRIELGDYRYFCEEIQIDLQRDELFESQYGEVVLVKLDEEQKYKRITDSKHLIPCIIETRSDKSYFVWIEFDTNTFSSSVQYDSIMEITKRGE